MKTQEPSGALVGNFEMGQCSCEVKCRLSHEILAFNIGRVHFVACDTCKTYVCAGSNLTSDWRQKNSATWRRNCSASDARGSRR